jgi:hypothetical protein
MMTLQNNNKILLGGILVHSGTGATGIAAGAGYVTRIDSGSGAGCH